MTRYAWFNLRTTTYKKTIVHVDPEKAWYSRSCSIHLEIGAVVPLRAAVPGVNDQSFA